MSGGAPTLCVLRARSPRRPRRVAPADRSAAPLDVAASGSRRACALRRVRARTFLSIAWAEDKGEAWDAANRTLLYLAVYGIFLLWPWRARHGAFSSARARSGWLASRRARSSASSRRRPVLVLHRRALHRAGRVRQRRLRALPVGGLAGGFLASRRETPWWLRGLFLAAAGFLLEQALLAPEPRLAVRPRRRAVFRARPQPNAVTAALAPVCLAAFVVRDPLLDLYPASRAETLPAALDALVEPLLGSAVVLFALGTVYGLVDRFAPLPSDVARVGRWVAGTLAVGGAVVIAAVTPGDLREPRHPGTGRGDEFASGQRADDSSSNFGSNLGSNRYDWRVAMGEFRDSPPRAARSFGDAYLQERKSLEEPLYPHSLPVMVLSQTGVVGGSCSSVSWAPRWWRSGSRGGERRRSGRRSPPSPWSPSPTGPYGLIDWFWEFPGLAGPAFAVGLAGGLERPGPVPVERPTGWTRRRMTAAALYAHRRACARLLDAALARRARSNALPTPGGRAPRTPTRSSTALGCRESPERPSRPPGGGDRHARRRFGRPGGVRAGARPSRSNWYAELELAVVAAQEGRRDEALGRPDRAEELNPLEEPSTSSATGILSGEPVDPHVLDRIFLQRIEERTHCRGKARVDTEKQPRYRDSDPVAATRWAGFRVHAALERREAFCGQQESSSERGGVSASAPWKEGEEERMTK